MAAWNSLSWQGYPARWLDDSMDSRQDSIRGRDGPKSKVNRAADDFFMLSQQRVTNEYELRGFAGNAKFINERRPRNIKFCRSVSDTLGIWKKYA